MRRTNILYHILIITVVVVLASCQRTQPQRPSQRNGVSAQSTDTTLLALMNMTQRLVLEADKELLRYVKQTDTTFALLEIGTWYKRLNSQPTQNEPLQEGEIANLQLTIRSLQQELLLNSIQTCKIGQEELPSVIGYILRESHHGDSIVLIVPWYSAYGVNGNEYVKPYQNVIIELNIQ